MVIAQSFQENGMSGSGVLNGCGYAGMAHAVSDSGSTAHFALIIPADVIREFFEANIHMLPTLQQCNANVVVAPKVAFVNCT